MLYKLYTMSEISMHYVDVGEFYSIYGVTSLIIVLLLLWYFIRSQMDGHNLSSCNADTREGLGGIPIEDPDLLKMMPEFGESYEFTPLAISPEGQPKPYMFWSGSYGDVPLNIYDIKDSVYKPEWDHNQQIYIPNMRTTFRKTADTSYALSYLHDF